MKIECFATLPQAASTIKNIVFKPVEDTEKELLLFYSLRYVESHISVVHEILNENPASRIYQQGDEEGIQIKLSVLTIV